MSLFLGGVVIVYERKVKLLYEDVTRLLLEITEAWKRKPITDPTVLPKGKSEVKEDWYYRYDRTFFFEECYHQLELEPLYFPTIYVEEDDDTNNEGDLQDALNSSTDGESSSDTL
ncbi:hypothetical protein GIB67_036527 [Kingdonia uniflora]|uniref:Rad21/Rec8-like protein N-terminal domain-containing protein n=1 Tax=Kingdonia uniflora TaxID=39325 RepID=A0A7J7P7N3_9MAGN|nr:hypothetical protein GIB67_036527 [Kingdonia uniflora]